MRRNRFNFVSRLSQRFVVSDKATLSFSLDGSRLFLGAAPPSEPEKNPDEEDSRRRKSAGRSVALERRLYSADAKGPR